MISLVEFCVQNGITLTAVADLKSKVMKRKLEHKYWKEGMNQAVVGYNEQEFTDKFVNFVAEINKPATQMHELSEADVRLIRSKPLKYHDLSR